MGSELANLVKRYGGEPVQAPALREVSIDAAPEVNALLDELQRGDIAFVIFQTGVGVAGLLGMLAAWEVLSRDERSTRMLTHALWYGAGLAASVVGILLLSRAGTSVPTWIAWTLIAALAVVCVWMFSAAVHFVVRAFECGK